MKNKTKIIFFLAMGAILSSCTAIKTASTEVERDPVYSTKEDITLAIAKANVEAERMALDRGEANNQGKRSGSTESKYDYMPATSYAERFNRTGNSFFLNNRAQNEFAFRHHNSAFRQNQLRMNGGMMGFGGMFNPYFGAGVGCNPWNNPWNDPWTNFYMMQTNAYPFFTYNPYMYSYGLMNNRFDPWMAGNSFMNPYFHNPYYNYNPWGFQNNSFRNTFQTASRPNQRYTQARRNTTVGNSSRSSATNNSANSRNTRTTNSSRNENTSNNSFQTRTWESSGSGSTRGGYNSSSRATRGTSTTRGTGRR